MRSRNLLLLLSACLAAPVPARAGEPSADDLIKLASAFDSNDEKCRSLEVRGYFKEPGAAFVKFRSIYRAPGQHAILISDGFDDTPIIRIADRKMLIYDPVSPAILLAEGTTFSTTIEKKAAGLQVMWDFHHRNKGQKEEPDRLRVDLQSILAAPSTERKVVKPGEKTYRLILVSTKHGSTLVASFDLTKASPCTSIKLFKKGEHEPVFCIDRITFNGVMEDEEFRFPAKEILAKELTVKDSPGDGTLKALGGGAVASRACLARIGANHPIARRWIKFPGLLGIHWDQVRANDAKYSAALRQLLSSQPPPANAPPSVGFVGK